jgi:hypothetical protein
MTNKLKITNKINIWNNFFWIISDPIINIEEDVVIPSLKDFNKKILVPLLDSKIINEDDIINIQFKVSSSNIYRSISLMQRIYIKDFNKLNDIFTEFWNSTDGEWYTQNQLDNIIYFYKIITKTSNVIEPKVIRFENSKLNKIKSYTHNISDIKVPMTMDLDLWGEVIFDSENDLAVIQKPNSNLRYLVDIEDYSYNVKILTKKDNLLLKFRDTILSRNDLNHFKREVYNNNGDINKIFIYKDNEVIIKSYTKSYTNITKLTTIVVLILDL